MKSRASSAGPKAGSSSRTPISSSVVGRIGGSGPSSRTLDAAAALERELALMRHAKAIQAARAAIGSFGGRGGGVLPSSSSSPASTWPPDLVEAAAAAGLALPPFPRGGVGVGAHGGMPPLGHGHGYGLGGPSGGVGSGGGGGPGGSGRSSGTILRMVSGGGG